MQPRLWIPLAVILLHAGLVRADFQFRNLDDPEQAAWTEEEVVLPPFPKEENLREFHVSAVTSNRFFIDATSISVGKDGVVRYTLLVRSNRQATNITYEGIRCSSRERKIYATGRQDGSWTINRNAKWSAIENKQINRHHAALWREFFCPGGIPIRTATEGEEALRLGGHPEAGGGNP